MRRSACAVAQPRRRRGTISRAVGAGAAPARGETGLGLPPPPPPPHCVLPPSERERSGVPSLARARGSLLGAAARTADDKPPPPSHEMAAAGSISVRRAVSLRALS